MSRTLLYELIQPLPYALREQISGYALSVEHAAQDIFRSANIAFSQDLADEFVYLSGIRRLWTLVDTQFWILDNSLSIMEQNNTPGFLVGQRVLERGSPEHENARLLREQLREVLRNLEVQPYVEVQSLNELLVMIAGRPHGPGGGNGQP